jgi:peptidyl-prolyl cis-trans isomerase SurA
MKKLFSILFIALLSLSQSSFALVWQDKIVAIVNNKPITRFNILQAKRMLTFFNKIETITPELDKQLNKAALENIINQTLIQEQKQIFKIKVPKEEIQNAIKGIEENNGLPGGFFRKIFQEQNIDYKYFEDKIEADILFKKIIICLSFNILCNYCIKKNI